MIISLLVAADEQNVIGWNNQLPWHLPNDLKYFKNQTWGMPILMGRKTFESIGKPLPGRKNIVITRNQSWRHDHVTVVHTMENAIESALSLGCLEIFIIGGAEIFESALPDASRIYLTRIHHTFRGDVYFPKIQEPEWELSKVRYCPADEKNRYPHTFQIWERKKAHNKARP
jgi:dihydrofolate reductase